MRILFKNKNGHSADNKTSLTDVAILKAYVNDNKLYFKTFESKTYMVEYETGCKAEGQLHVLHNTDKLDLTLNEVICVDKKQI